jgi:hypothetical protein
MAIPGGKLFTQFKPYIIVNKIVDACDSLSKTRVVVRVNIGEIKKSDSLYGYDIELKYDPTKIKFINYLVGNTLSEFFEEKSFSLGLEGDKVKGYATTFNFNVPPAYGDSILVAFSAEWIGGSCLDSSWVEITSLNFTDEFKKKLSDTLGGGYVNVQPMEKADRIIKLKPDLNELYLIDNQENIDYKLSVVLPEYNFVNKLKLYFNGQDTIAIKNVKSSGLVSIDNISDNQIDLSLNGRVVNFNLDINAIYTLKDTLSNFKYVVSKIEYNDCSCVFNFNADGIVIKKDSNIVSVVERNNFVLDRDGIIKLDNLDQKIRKISIYNILGSEIYEENTTNKTEIKIFTEEFKENIYFIRIEKYDKIEIKKFYKCYSTK